MNELLKAGGRNAPSLCWHIGLICIAAILSSAVTLDAQVPNFGSRLSTIEAPNAPIEPFGVKFGTVGDIDGDGLDDLIRIDSDLGILLVGRSLGQSIDASIATFPTPVGGQALVAGDLDGDGDEDVCVAYSGLGGVGLRVHWNDGAGDLSASADILVGTSAFEIRLLDFNGDGQLDVYCSFTFQSAVVLLNQGGQAFSAPVFLPSTSAVRLGDVDGDGDSDLVELVGMTFALHLGDGTGNFSPSTVISPALAANAERFELSDIDLDGDLDIVQLTTSNLTSTTMVVVVRRTPTAWTPEAPQEVAGSLFSRLVPPADFDGNGSPDLIVYSITSSQSKGFTAAMNDGMGGFSESSCVTSNGALFNNSSSVGDINGDGRADFALFSDFGKTLVSYGTPSGDLRGARVIDTRLALTALPMTIDVPFVVGDFNRDGQKDAIQASNHNGGVDLIWASSLNGSVSVSVQTIPGFATSLACGDLNRDGYQDLILGSGGGLNGVAAYLGDGTGGFTLGRFVITPEEPRSVVVEDMNGDGWLDVLAAGVDLQLILNTGTGDLSTMLIEVGCGAACGQVSQRDAAVADVNQDGVLDVVVSADSAFLGLAEVEIYLGDGLGGFNQAAPLLVLGQIPNALSMLDSRIGLADLNGDGIIDIVHSGLIVNTFFGLGAGQFVPAQSIYTGMPGLPQVFSGQLALADLNGDDQPEIVFARGAILENLGGGQFAATEELATGGTAVNVAVTDVNGDLQPDIVIAEYASRGWVVFENSTVCPAQAMTIGEGCPGAGGFTPRLTISGCAGPSGTTTLRLTQAQAGAAASLLVGPMASDIPFGAGCNLYVDPVGLVFLPVLLSGPTGIPGQGSWSLPLTWPASIAPGFSLALQAVTNDPAAIGGFASSNGVFLVIL